MSPGQFFVGQVSYLRFGFEFGIFPLKIPNFSIFSLPVKNKSHRVGSKSTQVKDSSTTYLLRVRSMLRSGQGPSLKICCHYDSSWLLNCVSLYFQSTWPFHYWNNNDLMQYRDSGNVNTFIRILYHSHLLINIQVTADYYYPGWGCLVDFCNLELKNCWHGRDWTNNLRS